LEKKYAQKIENKKGASAGKNNVHPPPPPRVFENSGHPDQTENSLTAGLCKQITPVCWV